MNLFGRQVPGARAPEEGTQNDGISHLHSFAEWGGFVTQGGPDCKEGTPGFVSAELELSIEGIIEGQLVP